jgi:hypothetical protein
VREVSVDWPDAFFFAGARAIDAACPWNTGRCNRLARVVVVSAYYASKQMNYSFRAVRDKLCSAKAR